MSSAYVLPPEHHIFERNSMFLVLDPVNFVWFITDQNGKETLAGLAKTGSAEGAACELGTFLGLEPTCEAVTSYISSYIEYLLKIKFIFEGEYQRENWGSQILEYPQILYMHLTSKCNLRCPYCYNQAHRTNMLEEGA